MPAITIRGLTRRFPNSDRASVEALDLAVPHGETLCIVGPSGCGKSTTLRLVAGLDVPTAGTIAIGDRDVTRVPPADRDVSMVFQGFALYPHMTARQILEFPLEMRRVPKGERLARVAEVSELLGITRLLDRRPPSLSGGEQQRVAMGRAIVRRPAAFLFDEPLSNLDAALRAELRVELGKLLAGLGATALYVTHDQAEAMTLGRRIAVMRAGKLEQCAPPREIYERPATAFVAGFFGSPPMNLVPTAQSGERVRALGAEFSPPEGARDCLLGIRPERVRVGRDAADGALPSAARVVAVEPHGADSHLELDHCGVSLRARVPGFAPYAQGDSVPLAIAAEDVRWFDAATGRAL